MGVGFGVMILKDNKILFGKKHDDPEKASSVLHDEGTWSMPGGKLEFGESFEDTAYRETLEECGIKINKNNLRLISITNDIVYDAHFVTIGFLCTEFEGEAQVMEPNTITIWKWFDITDLPKPMYKSSEKILKNYFDKTVYKH